MFVDPVSTVTSVGQVVAVLRDGIATVAVCVIGWKARDWVQPVFDFFKKANLFMDESTRNQKVMTDGMVTLLNNHLPHIEAALGAHKGRTVEVAEPIAEVVMVDVPADKDC
jgi:hypothetical protein